MLTFLEVGFGGNLVQGFRVELMKIRDEDFEFSFGLWMIVIDPQLMLMTTCKSRSCVHAQLLGAP